MAVDSSVAATEHRGGPESGASAAAPRQRWIDTVKGTAIVLVVLGHAYGLQQEYGWQAHGLWNDVNILLGLWRMPVFMVVAGFFVTRSLEKYGRQYWRRRPLNMLWLFVVWTVVFAVSYLLIGAVSDTLTPGAKLGEWVHETLTFDSYLWFLIALAVYYGLQAVVGTRPRIGVVLVALALYVLFVPGLVDKVSWGSNEVPQHWLFFLAGAWGSSAIRTRVPQIPVWQGLAWCVAFAVSLLLWMPIRDVPVLEHFTAAVPPLLGIPAGMWLLHLLDGRRGMGWARAAGSRSLPIYVLHAIILQLLLGLMTRVAWPEAMGTVMLWAGPVLLTVLTVVVALVIHRVTGSVPLLWGLPQPADPPASRGRHAV